MNNMLLITSPFGDNNRKTFKMVPVDTFCPFNEAIFNNDHNVLAVISKEKKDTHFMVNKLNDQGQPEVNAKKDGYKQTRTTLEKYYEYYITEPDEITAFINRFAVNATTFDFQSFFKVPSDEEATASAEEAVL